MIVVDADSTAYAASGRGHIVLVTALSNSTTALTVQVEQFADAIRSLRDLVSNLPALPPEPKPYPWPARVGLAPRIVVLRGFRHCAHRAARRDARRRRRTRWLAELRA